LRRVGLREGATSDAREGQICDTGLRRNRDGEGCRWHGVHCERHVYRPLHGLRPMARGLARSRKACEEVVPLQVSPRWGRYIHQLSAAGHPPKRRGEEPAFAMLWQQLPQHGPAQELELHPFCAGAVPTASHSHASQPACLMRRTAPATSRCLPCNGGDHSSFCGRSAQPPPVWR